MSPAIPEGWQLVPIEPPDALAAHLTDYSLRDAGMSERDRSVVRDRLRKRWAAILSELEEACTPPQRADERDKLDAWKRFHEEKRLHDQIEEHLTALIECYQYPQRPEELDDLVNEARAGLFLEIEDQIDAAYWRGREDERAGNPPCPPGDRTPRLWMTVADVLRIVDANESRQDIERALIANLPATQA